MQFKKAISSLLVVGSVVALVLFGLSENTANAENTTLQTPTETTQTTNMNGNLNLVGQPFKSLSPMPGGPIPIPPITVSGTVGNTTGNTSNQPLQKSSGTLPTRVNTLTAQ